MSFRLEVTPDFEKSLKKLTKKYPSLKQEIKLLGLQLKENPTLGTAIGLDCYKIRISIKSKGKGKSGGGRVITHLYVEKETVYLLALYDKSEYENISEKYVKDQVRRIRE